MSFRTIGYIEGKPIEVDEGPAYGGSPKLGGSLVVAQPTAPKTSEADRQTSRRYRARHPDRVAEYQRQYRARAKAQLDDLREERAS